MTHVYCARRLDRYITELAISNHKDEAPPPFIYVYCNWKSEGGNEEEYFEGKKEKEASQFSLDDGSPAHWASGRPEKGSSCGVT